MSLLSVDINAIPPSLLLECWTWLIPPSYTPLVATAVGDLFLSSPTCSVYWLDAGAGRLTITSFSTHEFSAAITDPVNIEAWFFPELVLTLRRLLGPLEKHQCYSFKLPPTLGGSYRDPHNYHRCDLVVHLGVLGQVNEQARHLPEGSVVAHFENISPREGPSGKP